MNGIAAQMAADLQLASSFAGQPPRLIGINAKRKKIDVEQRLGPVRMVTMRQGRFGSASFEKRRRGSISS
jgi:hypothetical protein